MKIWQNAKTKIMNSLFDEYISRFLSGDDVQDIISESVIDQDTALKYTAVFACNRVLSETFASLPINVYKKSANGDREPYTDTKIYDILHNRPNEEMTAFNWKEVTQTNINLGGNAISEKLVNSRGELVGLYPYKWQNVTISRDKDTGRLIYTVKINGREKILARDQVFHIAGPSFDGVVGLTPLEYISGAVRLGLSYEKFGTNFYKNGANTNLVFEHPAGLSDMAFQRLKDELAKNIQGLRNTGKPLLLEEGMKAKEISIKPADAELLESKRFQVEDICRIYRVPLHLVQNLERATFSNIEHQSLEFVMYTMLPHCKRAEENINSQLLTEKERRNGVYAEFNMSGLLRGDMKTRADAYAIGRQWGWLSINDIRKLENMNSIEGGDTYLQPLNMINVTKADDYYSKEVEDKNTEQKEQLKNEILTMLKGGK